ncbi:exportin-T-like isoform X1, partial [Paramuricea clavata]
MLLKNSYFQFIASLVNNNVVEVILSQEPQNTQEVLLTIIHGAVEPSDSSCQKACFGILKKLVELWGNTDGPAAFQEFLYNHIIPSCFVAPSKPEFDLNDAQTMLVSEKLVFIKGRRGEWGSEASL